jgi:signal transduction histidine kinase/ligand-binding sensor domain-containing protein
MRAAAGRLLAIVTLGASMTAHAQIPLHHSTWTIANGAPGEVDAIAQTTDGFLWLGATAGLFRFDGVTFERYVPPSHTALPSENISSLFTLPDGTLWVGYRFGGASHISGRELTSYGEAQGLPRGSLNQFVRDSAGTLWAATTTGLARFERTSWRRIDGAGGYPAHRPTALLVDRRGTLWVNDVDAVFVLPRGARTFIRRAASLGDSNGGALGEAPDGSVYGVSVTDGLIRLSNPDGGAPPAGQEVSPRSAGMLLVDAGANVWMGDGKGVVRIALDRRTAPASSSLTGAIVTAFLEDREKNVWVGTEHGLDQFRADRLVHVPLPVPVLAPALVAGDAHDVWSGSFTGPMFRIGERAQVMAGTPESVDCAYRDPDGTLWVANRLGLWHLVTGRWELVPTPSVRGMLPIQAMVRDRDGTLWVSIVRTGVFRRSGSTWSAFVNPWGEDPRAAIAMTADERGRVWMGYPDGRVALVDGDSTRRFTVANGVTVGNVLAIHARDTDVVIGGEKGLERFDGTRFIPITGAGQEVFRGISGIAEAKDGELWLHGADGITRIPSTELARHRTAPSTAVRFERFDYRDGLDGTASQIRPLPSAIAAGDGRIWFATSSSILHIDPAHIARNPLPPPVQIRSVDAEGATYSPDATVRLPARTRNVQIKYTALSLAIPERVRFRYQLAGSDTGWQDAGSRREAFYTNLRPGIHRFRVIAANEDGLWNEAGAFVDIDIPPTFVQTPWFTALCALAGLLAIWSLFRLRQHQVARAIQARFDATLAERTRIARELHDTLLQNFTGVTLQLYAVKGTLGARPDEAAAGLDRAVADADAALRDARYMVWDMRAPELDRFDLPDALAAAARTAMESTTADLRFSTRGTTRPLPREIEFTAFRIGREAVVNASRHADARTIDVVLEYAPRMLTLLVRDDGHGFAATAPGSESLAPHWGIIGMRERAEAVGGTFAIASVPGDGTSVTVTIPLDA